jgi:ribosomal protein S18 acetylase RimI-like enzyme
VWIRPAGIDDSPRIAAIEVAARREGCRGLLPQPYLEGLSVAAATDRWRRFFALDDGLARLILAEDETGTTVGFAAVGEPQAGALGWDAELQSLLVLPRCRGRGLARRLLRDLALHLDETGTSSLGVWVMREDESARGLYARLGARALGERVVTVGGRAVVEIAYVFAGLDGLLRQPDAPG